MKLVFPLALEEWSHWGGCWGRPEAFSLQVPWGCCSFISAGVLQVAASLEEQLSVRCAQAFCGHIREFLRSEAYLSSYQARVRQLSCLASVVEGL